MLVEIAVAQQGMMMSEATLVAWHVQVGAFVEKGDTIAEISTDKVEMQVEAPVAGRLVEQLVHPDMDFGVPGVIGYIQTPAIT